MIVGLFDRGITSFNAWKRSVSGNVGERAFGFRFDFFSWVSVKSNVAKLSSIGLPVVRREGGYFAFELVDACRLKQVQNERLGTVEDEVDVDEIRNWSGRLTALNTEFIFSN